VRWAGIIWGLVFAVSAALLLWVFSEPERRDAVGDWWATLTPIGFALTALLIAGGLLLIGGIAGLARRLSHRPA
jgi:CDP-diglyceride synthetase